MLCNDMMGPHWLSNYDDDDDMTKCSDGAQKVPTYYSEHWNARH